MFAQQYKGFTIHKGRTFQDYRVSLNDRTRYGTLAEVRSDVDAFLAGTLKAPQRGYH
jgi:hypothetical protein